MKIFISTNGCERRLLDASVLAEYFHKNGYIVVEQAKKADLILFIGCAFHERLVEDSLQRIKNLQRFNKKLIVGGCLPEVEKRRLSSIFDGDTISTKDLYKIDSIIHATRISFSDMPDANRLFRMDSFSKRFPPFQNFVLKLWDFYARNKYGRNSSVYLTFVREPTFYIRITWGCDERCTFCTIRKSTGKFRSKPVDECLREFKDGLKKGYRYFVLVGENTGAYGIDKGVSLPYLLRKFMEIEGSYEIIIRDLNPRWLVKYAEELLEIVSSGKITKIGIAIQSGSERILRLMRRYHDIEKIKETCHLLKKRSAKLSLDGLFIVGFPTETREDFTETLHTVDEIRFSDGFFIPFSYGESTDARSIEPKVPTEEIKRRLRIAKDHLREQGYRCFFNRWGFLYFSDVRQFSRD